MQFLFIDCDDLILQNRASEAHLMHPPIWLLCIDCNDLFIQSPASEVKAYTMLATVTKLWISRKLRQISKNGHCTLISGSKILQVFYSLKLFFFSFFIGNMYLHVLENFETIWRKRITEIVGGKGWGGGSWRASDSRFLGIHIFLRDLWAVNEIS